LGEAKPLIDLISLLEKDIDNLKQDPSPKHALIVLTTIENLQTGVVCLENELNYASSNQLSTSQLKQAGFWQNIKNINKYPRGKPHGIRRGAVALLQGLYPGF